MSSTKSTKKDKIFNSDTVWEVLICATIVPALIYAVTSLHNLPMV